MGQNESSQETAVNYHIPPETIREFKVNNPPFDPRSPLPNRSPLPKRNIAQLPKRAQSQVIQIQPKVIDFENDLSE